MKKKTGGWQEFWVDVDSGAVVSFFNKDDCKTLGYELKDGSFCEIKSVGGTVMPCYIHSLDMKIGDEIITARVAFSDTPKHGLLLGRLDVFNYFEVDFRGKTLDTFFARDF